MFLIQSFVRETRILGMSLEQEEVKEEEVGLQQDEEGCKGSLEESKSWDSYAYRCFMLMLKV